VKVIKFRTAAAADMRRIAIDTRTRWGDEQAALYSANLRHAIKSLGIHPLRHPELGSNHPGLRYMTSGRHAVFYLVGANRIEIVRVLHTAMDFGRWLD
jgi:toxin ParE1/3/4